MIFKTEEEGSEGYKMLTRILTAIVSLVVFVAVLLLPQWVFVVAVALIMAVMAYESMDCTKVSKRVKAVGVIGALIMIAAFVYKIFGGNSAILPASVVAAIMLHCVMVVIEHGKTQYTDIFASCLFLIYIIMTMGCVAFCRADFGTGYMMLIFVCAWTTDTGAYFTGRALGKHKLIPHVSPNKTVEGAIGGVIVCMLCCFVYSIIINRINAAPLVSIDCLKLTIIGTMASVVSQLGDLVASSIKRDTQIKDFGKIFPGHGGFLDRFDSVIFVSPVIYGLFCIML